MSNLKQNCMGTTVMARITHDTVELNLPEWSGRMTREEARHEINDLIVWLWKVRCHISDGNEYQPDCESVTSYRAEIVDAAVREDGE